MCTFTLREREEAAGCSQTSNRVLSCAPPPVTIAPVSAAMMQATVVSVAMRPTVRSGRNWLMLASSCNSRHTGTGHNTAQHHTTQHRHRAQHTHRQNAIQHSTAQQTLASRMAMTYFCTTTPNLLGNCSQVAHKLHCQLQLQTDGNTCVNRVKHDRQKFHDAVIPPTLW